MQDISDMCVAEQDIGRDDVVVPRSPKTRVDGLQHTDGNPQRPDRQVGGSSISPRQGFEQFQSGARR